MQIYDPIPEPKSLFVVHPTREIKSKKACKDLDPVDGVIEWVYI